MESVQGTWLGVLLDDNRTSLSGWVEGSYTGSTARVNNQPVVWNDRANEFLLNQAWFRLERSLVTSGTTDPSFGYRLDYVYGSDYRFTLMRGLFNNQLLNADGNQNFYGSDLLSFYGNMFVPTLFQGTEFRVGRLWTPWGYESLEGVSTPFVSRSYAFNWSPPFTHMGIGMYAKLSDRWSTVLMLANGNDVFFDPAQEARFVGNVSWNSGRRDTVTFGWSLGRGKFNVNEPFSPATVGLDTEPAGRNNINVIDLVWSHALTPKLTYATELIYGWQYDVPANVVGGIIDADLPTGAPGDDHWGSWVQYLTYTFNPKLTGITRFELFEDFEGQRTGFEGLYTAITMGFQYRPIPALMIRPEVRYDSNNYSRPFEGKRDLFTAALDVIVRW
jgi:hypothetical protein